MNYSFDIMVDSAANLTDEMIATCGIKVIPFTYTINGELRKCYEEGVPFSVKAKEFYESMEKNADIKTSLVCEEDFIDAVAPSMEQGRDVLLITITESLSGTCNQAVKAQNALKTRFPQRKLIIVDSANASLGEGLLALRAANLRDMGSSVEDCAKWVEDNKYKVNSYVTVNDLKYLKRSGRVSAITAIAGAILNIKPMLKADGGCPAKLVVYGKERGRKKSIDAIVKGFTDNVTDPANQLICIAHSNCEEEANQLAQRLKELGANDIVIEYYDLCTGSHVGPGTLALFFMGNDRRKPVPEAKKFGKFAAQRA